MSQATFADLKREFGQVLVERDREIYLGLIAVVAREHLFMLGPPGTGKTALASMLGRAVPGGFFEILLSKFTEPSEVFGPLSVKGLMERDEYRRSTAGYMPDCRLVMLDEVWKASSAILNNLLTILNERVFDNGGVREVTRVGTVFGASNEMPADDSLAAIYDRFMLRCEVAPVSDSMKLLNITKGDIPQISEEYLLQMQQAADAVQVSSDVHRALVFIRDTLRGQGIVISDRRFLRSVGLVRASAAIAHRSIAAPQDLKILAYCFWVTPDQAPAVKLVVEDVVNQFQSQLGTGAQTASPAVPAQMMSAMSAANPTMPVPLRGGSGSTNVGAATRVGSPHAGSATFNTPPVFQAPNVAGNAPGIPVGSRGNPNRAKPKHVPQFTAEQLRSMGQTAPGTYTQVGSPQQSAAPGAVQFSAPSQPVAPTAPRQAPSQAPPMPSNGKPAMNFSKYTKEELNQWIIARMCKIAAVDMAWDTDLEASLSEAQARIARDPTYTIPEKETVQNALRGIADARRRAGI